MCEERNFSVSWKYNFFQYNYFALCYIHEFSSIKVLKTKVKPAKKVHMWSFSGNYFCKKNQLSKINISKFANVESSLLSKHI